MRNGAPPVGLDEVRPLEEGDRERPDRDELGPIGAQTLAGQEGEVEPAGRVARRDESPIDATVADLGIDVGSGPSPV